jgi:hypothetical protein
MLFLDKLVAGLAAIFGASGVTCAAACCVLPLMLV